jgi:hypothetical protein
MSRVQRLNLTLRALMELGVVVGLAYWGVDTGGGVAAKIALGLAAPAVGFGFWGAVDFHRFRLAEPLRLIQELAISGLAAVAWYAAGQPVLGIALGALSIVYHGLVYASGERLIKPSHDPAAGRSAAAPQPRSPAAVSKPASHRR